MLLLFRLLFALCAYYSTFFRPLASNLSRTSTDVSRVGIKRQRFIVKRIYELKKIFFSFYVKKSLTAKYVFYQFYRYVIQCVKWCYLKCVELLNSHRESAFFNLHTIFFNLISMYILSPYMMKLIILNFYCLIFRKLFSPKQLISFPICLIRSRIPCELDPGISPHLRFGYFVEIPLFSSIATTRLSPETQ